MAKLPLMAFMAGLLAMYSAGCVSDRRGTVAPSNTSPTPHGSAPSTRPPVGSASTPLLPVPVDLARRDLARRLGQNMDEVEIVTVEDVVWPDSCLGLPSPELCAPGSVAGYAVVFRLSGKEFRYHTDRQEAFRYAGPGDEPTP